MSRKKKKHQRIYVGKGIPPTIGTRSPMKGAPNTNIDFYDPANGKFVQRRKFGMNGIAVKDLDAADHHKSDHAHDIGIVNGKIHRNPVDRVLTKQEHRELDRAKRKRKFFPKKGGKGNGKT